MTPKVFLGLTAVTAVIVVAAAVTVVERYGAITTLKVDEPAFPGLIDKVNQVAEISVVLNNGELDVKRKGDRWVLASRNDHPVAAEKVNKALIQLSQLYLYEPKTKLPKRYSRIHVEEVTQEKAQSKLLTLKDAAGKVIARTIVGETQYFMAGPSKRGVYLRKPDEAQAWLAAGVLEVGQYARDWVVRDIMDVASKRMRSVETTAPDGTRLAIVKAAPEDAEFKIEDLAEGVTLKPSAPGTLRDMATAVAAIDLNDVVPAADKPLEKGDVWRAVLRTFDGLVIELSLTKEEGDEFWARFKASVDPQHLRSEAAAGGGDAAAAQGEVKAPDKAGADAAKDAMTPAGPRKDALKTADEVRKEAEQINARVAGWTYNIPYYKGNPLVTKLDDLIDSGRKDKSS